MIPKYLQISDQLRAQLTGNERASIQKLPTEQELCEHFHASRQTIRHALQILEQEGLIERRQGSGAYATGLHPDSEHNQIAVLLPTDSDYTYAKLRSELQLPLVKEGFAVSFFLTEFKLSREREILHQLLELPLRGLIIDPVKNALPNPNLDYYERLWSKRVPTVFLQQPYLGFPQQPFVCSDDYDGGRQAAQYLLARHHTKIATLLPSDSISGMKRYLGILHACNESHITWDDRHLAWYSDEEWSALQKKQATGFLSDFIRRKLGTCSAVICHNDEIAYWLIKELSISGRHVPEDISVISFDNSYLSDFSVPGLTSFGHRQTLASTAANTLLTQMRGQDSASVTLSFHLYERDSCHSLA